MKASASVQTSARLAGGLYLLNIIGGIFAIGFVSIALVAGGDPAATMQNIQANETLYRMSLAAHLIILVTNPFLGVIFYDLFKVVNRKAALLVIFFTLIGTSVEAATLLNDFTPLLFLRGSDYASLFTVEQLQALAMMPLDMQTFSYNIFVVFFGVYGVLIGYLIFRATFLPRAVGVLMVIGGLSYLINSFATFLAPEFASHLFPYIQLPSLLGEGSLCLWLLIRGVNVEQWEKRAAASV